MMQSMQSHSRDEVFCVFIPTQNGKSALNSREIFLRTAITLFSEVPKLCPSRADILLGILHQVLANVPAWASTITSGTARSILLCIKGAHYPTRGELMGPCPLLSWVTWLSHR